MMKGVKMYSKDKAPNNEYNFLISDNAYLEKLLDEIVLGDKDALAELYQGTKTLIYGYLLSLLKHKAEVEDVFQDVYIKIYENAALYQSKGKPLAWILTIAKNECLMKLRKRKDNVDIDLIKEFFPDKKKDNIEDKIILTTAFKTITDEERNILILHVLGGLKHREIAKMLDLSLSTVLSKYNRTLKKLREVLKEDIV